MENHHFLLISLPAQGHINPTLQLAQRLARAGARVTFATTVHGLKSIKTRVALDGLSYASFSDGSDDGAARPSEDPLARIKRVGSDSLKELVISLSKENRSVTFLVYTILLPWVADVARDLGIPSAFLGIQSATVLAIYLRYFNSHNGFYNDAENETPACISLPGLPPLTPEDLPSFLLPTSPHFSITPTFLEHIQTLEQDSNPCVLLNTFDALEQDLIRAIGKDSNMKLLTIGPLIPLAFLNGKDSPDKSFGCDLFDSSIDYTEWLDLKPKSSVIYVSFGSMVVLKRNQIEELFSGLCKSGRPFLWVIRSSDVSDHEVDAMIKRIRDEDLGLVVPWCPQLEVLNHKSIGCHVTHCGWNSTLESLAAGVVMIGCPQFSDQLTNAKLIEEVWKIGIKARFDEEGIVRREEIQRCLEIVMDATEEGHKMRENAAKWKALAMEAAEEGGTSNNNLRQFMEWIK